MAADTDRTDTGAWWSSWPGWLLGTLAGVVGVSALGLPVALTVAALDLVRRDGTPVERGIVLAGLVLAGVVLVIGVERGLTYAVRRGWSLWAVAGTLLGLGLLVAVGVLLPGLGLVLVALGVVLAALVAPAALGLLAWWRWRTLPTTPPRTAPRPSDVHARAERRRAAVRARHDRTRQAVAAGLVGPGFTARR